MTERKVVIVTGSATGVGAATALLLARRGYDVLINYSKSEARGPSKRGGLPRGGGRHTAAARRRGH